MHHVREGFDCGNESLNRWLLLAALDADRGGTARTFVWSDSGRVVAYISLVPHQVRKQEVPTKVRHGAPDVIPAILLARLALQRELQGRGLGAQLLVDALSRCVAAVDAAGGRLIVVDAIDDRAMRFYQHYGFKTTPKPHRLVMKASDARYSMSSILK